MHTFLPKSMHTPGAFFAKGVHFLAEIWNGYRCIYADGTCGDGSIAKKKTQKNICKEKNHNCTYIVSVIFYIMIKLYF